MELLTSNTGVPVEQFTTKYPRLKQCSNIARKMRLSGWMILVQCTRSTTRSYSQSSKEVFENVGGGAVAVSVREDIAGGKVNNPSDDQSTDRHGRVWTLDNDGGLCWPSCVASHLSLLPSV